MASPHTPAEKSKFCSNASVHNALQFYTKVPVPLKSCYSSSDLMEEDFASFLSNHSDNRTESFGWSFTIAPDLEKIMQSVYYQINSPDADYTPHSLLPYVHTTSNNRQVIRMCDVEVLLHEEIWKKKSDKLDSAVKRAVVTQCLKGPNLQFNGPWHEFCYYDVVMNKIQEYLKILDDPVEVDGEYVYDATTHLNQDLRKIMKSLPQDNRLLKKIEQMLKPNKNKTEEIDHINLALLHARYFQFIKNRRDYWPNEKTANMLPVPQKFFQVFEDAGNKFVLEEDVDYMMKNSSQNKQIIIVRSVPEAMQMLGKDEKMFEIVTLPTVTIKQSVIPLLCLNGNFAFGAAESFFTSFTRFFMSNGTYQKATRPEIEEFFCSLKNVFRETKLVYYLREDDYENLLANYEQFAKRVSSRQKPEIRFFDTKMFSKTWLKRELWQNKLHKIYPDCHEHVEDVYEKFKVEADMQHAGGLSDLQYCIGLCLLRSICTICPFLTTFLHNQKSCSRVPGLECCGEPDGRNDPRHQIDEDPFSDESDSDEELEPEDEPSTSARCNSCSKTSKRCHKTEQELEDAKKKIKLLEEQNADLRRRL